MDRKLLTASSPFSAVRDGQFTMPRFVDVDLTNARTEQTALEIPIAGNVLYCDANPSDGNCVIEFNDVGRDPGTDTPFYASPGFIANVPYTRIRVYNDAQPGKKIRIVYGVDIPFQPGSVGSLSLSQAQINQLVRPLQSTGSFVDNTAALGALLTIFTPAQNPNGAIILNCAAHDQASVSGTGAFLANATPPASPVGGEIICGLQARTTISPVIYYEAQLDYPVFIAAGKGMYYIQNFVGAGAGFVSRSCRYILL